jgi:hypothetical protein
VVLLGWICNRHLHNLGWCNQVLCKTLFLSPRKVQPALEATNPHFSNDFWHCGVTSDAGIWHETYVIEKELVEN